MRSITELISIALTHHQAGRLLEAEEGYRQILTIDPGNVATWHLAGRLMDQAGRRDEAVECLERAVRIWPEYAEAHSDLGTVLEAQGKLEEAAAAYQRAVELNPAYAIAHFNLGNLLLKQQKRVAAAESFHRALSVNPNLAQAHTSLGSVLSDQGQIDGAIASFRQALHIVPQCTRSRVGLGLALQRQGTRTDAEACFRRALDLEPHDVDAQFNLGLILEEQGSLDEAIRCYRRVLELKSDHAKATQNLCRLLWMSGCVDEAFARIRFFLTIEPNSAEAISNLGILHTARQQWEDAERCFEHAIQLKPDLAEAHIGRAHIWLLKGNYAEGWPEYEWRWKDRQMPNLRFTQPQWKGEPLAGKTVLLQTEQGFGDTLQFIRYAEVLQRYGASVSVRCPKSLVRLLARCRGVNQIVGEGEEVPPFDFYIPLLSVPTVIRTELNTVPTEIPYLSADPLLVSKWGERLDELIPRHTTDRLYRDLRVGINWHGRSGPGVFRQRDIPLEMFATLSGMPGVRLLSLQKSECANVGARSAYLDFGQEIDRVNGAFMDTAAIMMNLDLVITSDTAIPHLAGALGVPVWLALPYTPDWRWLLDRSDSPWYPTMRLFRQKKLGDWAGVFEEIEAALRARVQGSKFKVES